MKNIVDLEIQKSEMYEDFYPKIMGKVFHYTSGINFLSILKDKRVDPIKSSGKRTSVHSHESMGRALKGVCLFDLREKPKNQIEKIRGWYNFLAPRFEDDTLVFLVISPDFYSDVITLSEIDDETKDKAMYLPHIESWHKGYLPLRKMEVIYRVKLLN